MTYIKPREGKGGRAKSQGGDRNGSPRNLFPTDLPVRRFLCALSVPPSLATVSCQPATEHGERAPTLAGRQWPATNPLSARRRLGRRSTSDEGLPKAWGLHVEAWRLRTSQQAAAGVEGYGVVARAAVAAAAAAATLAAAAVRHTTLAVASPPSPLWRPPPPQLLSPPPPSPTALTSTRTSRQPRRLSLLATTIAVATLAAATTATLAVASPPSPRRRRLTLAVAAHLAASTVATALSASAPSQPPSPPPPSLPLWTVAERGGAACVRGMHVCAAVRPGRGSLLYNIIIKYNKDLIKYIYIILYYIVNHILSVYYCTV